MKIIVLNGSPRKGNTLAAINAFVKGAANHDVEVIDTYKYKVGPCLGCGVCKCMNGCIAKDDTNMIIDKLVAADMIVFASPVYWWGITAQLKLFMDKCYCRGVQLRGKKIGIIAVGGAGTDGPQYELIRGQFKCISEYLDWEIVFHNSYSASALTDLAGQPEAMAEMEAAGANL